MKKILLYMIIGLLAINLASAEVNPCGNDNSFIKGRQNDIVTLKQTCDSCTYVNLSSITYPNSTLVIYNSAMTKNGIEFTTPFSNTNILGCYTYVVFGDKDGTLQSETIDLKVTSTGEEVGSSQTIVIIGILGAMALFFGLGRAFNKDKWKIKLTFDILAIIMALIAINSIRIIATESENLANMTQAGLIVVIAILGIMVAYFLIMMTIEVVGYFKKRRDMRWQVTEEAY